MDTLICVNSAIFGQARFPPAPAARQTDLDDLCVAFPYRSQCPFYRQHSSHAELAKEHPGKGHSCQRIA